MFDAEIKKASEKYGIDESTIRGIIQTESGFNADYVGSNGSRGLMGLSKNTAKSLGVTNPFDAAQSIDAGTRYLSILQENSNGDLNRALQKFNGTTLDTITYAETVKVNGSAGIGTDDTLETETVKGKDKTNFIGDIVVVISCILLFILAFICLLKAFGVTQQVAKLVRG